VPFHEVKSLSIALIILFSLCLLPPLNAASDLVILVEREKAQGKLVPGQLSVDGKIIGRTFENVDAQILPGQYRGVLRYVSHNDFVQGEMGTLAHAGDFLLEVSGVPGRTNILFHGGNKPYQSRGCILLGPVGRDLSTLEVRIGPDHPLRQLRQLFYGTDTPTATPGKDVVITIK
jgi:hypothetical protein